MYTSGHDGNLSGTERTWSTVIGTALTLLVLRPGSPILRSLAVAGGLGFLARALAGHCGVKAAVTGEASLGEGMRQQWRMMSGGRGSSYDVQENVEERADPQAVQEGRATRGPVSSASTTAH